MSTVGENVLEAASEPHWKLSFSAVELAGSSALGADLRLDLAPHVTVLVGRNGAGKSLLLAMLQAGVAAARGVPSGEDLARFACEVDVRENDELSSVKLYYECRFQLRNAAFADARTGTRMQEGSEPDIKVEETCRLHAPNGALLWQVDDGLVTYNTGERAEIATGRTLVSWTISRRRKFLLPSMAAPLRDLFWGVVRVPGGVLRGNNKREELVLPYPEPSRRSSDEVSHRLRRLAYNLANWHEQALERFDEFVALGRRIGLLDQIKVKLYRDPEANPGAPRRDLVRVLVDGTDLGLLSDGTLRATELLMWLLLPGHTLLLIEEPETVMHPGLLSRLLAEFNTYMGDLQIVLSTQSPQVVSWADPRAIRLVERRTAHTEVRRLGDDEVERLAGYLHDEGTLGEFVYSGALDD